MDAFLSSISMIKWSTDVDSWNSIEHSLKVIICHNLVLTIEVYIYCNYVCELSVCVCACIYVCMCVYKYQVQNEMLVTFYVLKCWNTAIKSILLFKYNKYINIFLSTYWNICMTIFTLYKVIQFCLQGAIGVEE